MVIFKNKSYQICTAEPDTNFLSHLDCEQPKWVVPDNSPLAAKILSIPYWEAAEDDDGNLTDIIPIEPPNSGMSVQEEIARLKAELVRIDSQAIRPLRAIAAETDTEEDRTILTDLEQQAKAIREQLVELEAADNG